MRIKLTVNRSQVERAGVVSTDSSGRSERHTRFRNSTKSLDVNKHNQLSPQRRN